MYTCHAERLWGRREGRRPVSGEVREEDVGCPRAMFFVSSFDCRVRIVGAAGRYYRPAASLCVLQRLSPINFASFSRSSSADDDGFIGEEAAAVLKAVIPKTRLNKLFVLRLGAAG